MCLTHVLTVPYDTFFAFSALFFQVLGGGCSQILRNGYHSAFNFSVYEDR